MPNTITKFKKYIDKLDLVYKNASKTSDLDSNEWLARAGANANEIVIPKLSLDGLGDYSRNSGYVVGDVTLTNETVQFNYDRGRKFSVDIMDNEETQGIAFGMIASELERTKVAPEMDAFRFATYSALAGTTVTGTLSTGAEVITALRVGNSAQEELQVDSESKYLYITPTLIGLVQDLETTKSKEVLANFVKIVKVPQTRFYSVIDLLDGSTGGEEAGGYIKNVASGKNINFMIVEKSAVMQYNKRKVSSITNPDDNDDADAYIFKYRKYGLVDAFENRVAGIYNHTKA